MPPRSDEQGWMEMCEELSGWGCGVAESRTNVQTRSSTDVSLCAKRICQHSARLPPRLARQSVSQDGRKRRPTLLRAGCWHLSVNS